MTDDTPPPVADRRGVEPIAIEDELRRSYLDYAMSVIVSRALPDARDGLKPVHRRILYAMSENGFTSGAQYRKSARTVGDVIGKYHPHGDVSVYMALVRMAQPFSMALLLIDGQGNFGSVDGDMPAAMRYTESRMTKAAEALLADLDRDTVDFVPNYDGSETEPAVLPARYPNLLVNGAGGIAVGMATNIPPHNLGEVVDACLAMIDDPEVSTEALLDIVPGPDFPTGGEIYGRSAPRQALMTGGGSVMVRGKAAIETLRKDREAIIITELPFQVNKALLVARIAELVREKRIEGVSDIRDESDRQGMRIVVEIKRDGSADVVLNQLYRFTSLQSSFGVNMLALDKGRPIQMGLRRLLEIFLEHREEVVVRRAKFDLNKARDRGHVLVGLAIAVANIDEFIRIIRSSRDPNEARERIMEPAWPAGDMTPLIALIQDPRTIVLDGDTVKLSDEQARAILALTLSRLTGLGRDDIFGEAEGLAATIASLLELLSSRDRIMAVVREELVEVRARFAVPRRTQILDGGADLEDEDLIVREDRVVTVTHGGYVKRTPLSTYRTQHRGGKGRSGMGTKDEDAVVGVFSASTHAPVLFFASNGKAYKLKVWRLPTGGPTSRGKAFVNLLPIEPGDRIMNVLPLPEDEASWERYDVVFATRRGDIRRNKLSDFASVNRAGKIAMDLEEGDHMVGVVLCTGDNHVLLTTAGGKSIRFRVDDLRVFKGRKSTGVRGVRLLGDDAVISMAVLQPTDATPAERRAFLRREAEMLAASGDADAEDATLTDDEEDGAEDAGGLTMERFAELGAQQQWILAVTDTGYGKRTSSHAYPTRGRGGQGVTAYDLEKARRGKLVAAFPVEEGDDLLMMTDAGQLIRIPVAQVKQTVNRKTKGVIIVRMGEGERVVSVERLADPGEAPETPSPDEPHGGALGQ